MPESYFWIQTHMGLRSPNVLALTDCQDGLLRLKNFARQARDHARVVNQDGLVVGATVACGNNSCYCRTAQFDPPQESNDHKVIQELLAHLI